MEDEVISGMKKLYEKIYKKVFSVPFFAKFLKIGFIKKLLDYEVLSYLFFGVLTTAVNFLAFWLVNLIKGGDYEHCVLTTLNIFSRSIPVMWTTVANAIAWVAAVLFAYITNKLFVFESKSKNPKVVIRELISFFGARLISFLIFEFALFSLLNTTMGINSYICKIITGIIVIIFNYIASKLVIFKNKSKETDNKTIAETPDK